MRYQLDTIPVWDALKAGTECPLCLLRKEQEQKYVESFLGASVMEPATRIEVNEKGFCSAHFAQLFRQPNRLGLALMTDTYLQDVLTTLEKLTKSSENRSTRSRFLGGGKAPDETAQQIEKRVEACVLCERLKNTLKRYAYTVVHLWKNDREFHEAFMASQGLCLPDYALTLSLSREALSGADAGRYAQEVGALVLENLRRIETELAWFTQKFDYRNSDKPWGNSRDALERALQKLSSFPKGSA